MQHSISLLVFFSLFIQLLHAQSFRLKEMISEKDITNDTIVIQSTYNGGWVGYETLDLAIIAENISQDTLKTGAKKIEYEKLQKDVLHTFCFAGYCYDTGTYVSPNSVDIFPGKADSSFLAHYLFDNRVHIRGINHIAYVFYNMKNPKDTAFVYVIYNTVVKDGIRETSNNNNLFSSPYPNPANDQVFFQCKPAKTNITLTITNLLGEIVEILQIPFDQEKVSINTRAFPTGVYYGSFYDKENLLTSKLFIVSH